MISISRRSSDLADPKLSEVLVSNLAELPSLNLGFLPPTRIQKSLVTKAETLASRILAREKLLQLSQHQQSEKHLGSAPIPPGYPGACLAWSMRRISPCCGIRPVCFLEKICSPSTRTSNEPGPPMRIWVGILS
jgi:hypothetical protein